MDTIKAIDHAAHQDDRWLFLATLALTITFAIAAARYFARQYERLIEDHRLARDGYQRSLAELVVQHAKLSADVVNVVARNTEALELFSERMNNGNTTRLER